MRTVYALSNRKEVQHDSRSLDSNGLLLVAFIVWFFWLKRSRGTRATTTSGGYQEALILVKGGYTPNVIVVQHSNQWC